MIRRRDILPAGAALLAAGSLAGRPIAAAAPSAGFWRGVTRLGIYAQAEGAPEVANPIADDLAQAFEAAVAARMALPVSRLAPADPAFADPAAVILALHLLAADDGRTATLHATRFRPTVAGFVETDLLFGRLFAGTPDSGWAEAAADWLLR